MAIPQFHDCLWGAFAFVALVVAVPLALAHEPASGHRECDADGWAC